MLVTLFHWNSSYQLRTLALPGWTVKLPKPTSGRRRLILGQISLVFFSGAGPPSPRPLWTVPTLLLRLQPSLVHLSLHDKMRGEYSCSACGHQLQDLTRLLLDYLTSEPLWCAILDTTSSILICAVRLLILFALVSKEVGVAPSQPICDRWNWVALFKRQYWHQYKFNLVSLFYKLLLGYAGVIQNQLGVELQ